MAEVPEEKTPVGGQAAEEEVPEEEEEALGLPFPNARVVRIIRENLKREHQLKFDVKVAANKMLGDILADISKSMDDEEYFTLSIEHFNKASRKYREIELQQKRIRKIKALLEKQRAELDEVVAEIEVENPTY
jgi:predicted nucleotide-binding protein (sugar kinase/HSP70/actin superfamily)